MRLHQVPIETFLSERRRSIRSRVEGLAKEHLCSDAEAETIRALTQEFAVEAPRLTDAPPEAVVEEVEYEAEDFDRRVIRTYELWRIRVPFEGEPDLLEVRPTRCEGMAWPVRVEGKRLVVEIKAKDETTEQIDQWCEDTVRSIRENLCQLERGFADFSASLESTISELIANRRAELEAREQRLAKLGARWVGSSAEEPVAAPGHRTADNNSSELGPQDDMLGVPCVDAETPAAEGPLRVFISSTFEDLRDHRAAVIDALTHKGADVLGMEDFGAQSEPPLDVCLRHVRECTTYVGLFGTRYGSVDPRTGKSVTHLEYDEARSHGLDIRVYFADPDWEVKTKYHEEGPAAMKLGDFKTELRQNHTYATFTTPEQLADRVCRDLFPGF